MAGGIGGGSAVVASNSSHHLVTVALAAADTGGGVLSWVNPEGVPIVVTELIINATTKASGACTVDAGVTEVTSTTSSDNLIDGLDVGTAAGYWTNVTNGGTNGKVEKSLAAGGWITISKATGAAAGLVGTATIEYLTVV